MVDPTFIFQEQRGWWDGLGDGMIIFPMVLIPAAASGLYGLFLVEKTLETADKSAPKSVRKVLAAHVRLRDKPGVEPPFDVQYARSACVNAAEIEQIVRANIDRKVCVVYVDGTTQNLLVHYGGR